MPHPYDLVDRIGTGATLGLIVLQTDETLEQEFRQIFTARDVAFYTARVPSGADVTTETLGAMEFEIPQAAALLPPSLSYDSVAYCCTSGATVIGPDTVSQLVQGACDVAHVTNPLTAVIAALNALKVKRLGLLTPYIESVTAPMRDALCQHGFTVTNCVSFEEAEEAKVARIAPDSIAQAALVAGQGDVDAVFLSCTNLRTLDVIDDIEATLGKPVISSNQALAWHMAQLSGIAPDLPVGRLMRG